MVPAWIEEFIEEHNQRVYGGNMSPRAKSVLRAMKLKEHEFWEREQADYVYGQDEGDL